MATVRIPSSWALRKTRMAISLRLATSSLVILGIKQRNKLQAESGVGMFWWAAITIFTSAFLLFQVQPIISKTILPWFGGSPAVWTTCVLFFQVLLLGGYAYAHVLTKHFSPLLQ